MCIRDRHILPSLKEQANMLPEDDFRSGEGELNRNRNIYRVLGRRRIDHYLKGAGKSLFSHHVYLLRDYRCGIAITMPLDPESPAVVEEAIRIKESTHATLRSAHMPGWDWGPENLLNYVAAVSYTHLDVYKRQRRGSRRRRGIRRGGGRASGRRWE